MNDINKLIDQTQNQIIKEVLGNDNLTEKEKVDYIYELIETAEIWYQTRMNKIMKELLEKEETSKEFTTKEIISFVDEKLKWMAEIQELKPRGKNITISHQDFYNLFFNLKQAKDKLKELVKHE